MKKKLLFILLVGICLSCSSCGTTQCYDQDYYYHYGHLITTPHYRVYPKYYRVYPRYYRVYPRYNRPNNPHPPRFLHPDPKPNRRSSLPVYYDPRPSRPSPQPNTHKPNKPRPADRRGSSAAGSRH